MYSKDIEYMAGFFDGEGHIKLPKPYNGRFCSLGVEVSQAFSVIAKNILEGFKENFGGNISYIKSRKPTKWKDILTWRACVHGSILFCLLMSPYLKLNKEKAINGIILQYRLHNSYPRNDIADFYEKPPSITKKEVLNAINKIDWDKEIKPYPVRRYRSLKTFQVVETGKEYKNFHNYKFSTEGELISHRIK